MAPSATFSAQPAVAALLADYEVSANQVHKRSGACRHRAGHPAPCSTPPGHSPATSRSFRQ
jgi:hypothetical protein